ncbi:MAG: hypothetical protein ACJAVR_002702 [Paracoccaceae bacterium]|jgi:hypothetical protein
MYMCYPGEQGNLRTAYFKSLNINIYLDRKQKIVTHVSG